VAAAAFERAARLAPEESHRARLLVAAADAAWVAGRADRAVALLGEARGLSTDAELLVHVDQLRGHIAVRRGPVMEGHAILVGAAERVARADVEVAISMLAEAVDATFFAGDVAAMARTAQRVDELLPADASTRSRFLAAMVRGMARVFTGDAQNGIASLRSAVRLAEQRDELRNDPRLLSWLVMGPLWLREADSGRALVEQAVEAARAQAALGILPWLLNRVARDHAMADAVAVAAVEYDEALRLARETGQDTETAAALAGIASMEARLGREAECRAHATEALALCDRLGVGLYGLWAVRALGELELALGRAAAAIEWIDECTGRLAALGIRDADLSPAPELVDACLRVGRRDAAVAAADGFCSEAAAKGQPWPLARAARCRGLVAPDDEFAAHFEEALELHQRTPDAFELARTRLAFGARLRRARQRTRAREQLRAALQDFDRLGAAPWSEQARAELQATGETARRRDFSTLDTLTRQELHVAQVLAAGRTTREAAAALFLSPKTIEYHLRSVYRKLGINSRSDLAGALDRDAVATLHDS
jgi:DNA-binding CsgD family transcriptional regulator